MTDLLTTPAALIGIPAIMVCGAAGLLLWRRKKTQSDPKTPVQGDNPPAPSAANAADTKSAVDQIQTAFREVGSKLKLSSTMKGASLSKLPVFLVAGPRGAGKTSVVEHSGLNPELLAGQVYQGSSLLPTRDLNIWVARGAVFIEISESVAADDDAVRAILKHLRPGRIAAAFNRAQPARAILVCVDQGAVGSAATPDDVVALARPWNRFVSLAASELGVRLPAYILLTKTDAMESFPEFVSNLSGNDLAQTVGATIRPFSPASTGVYAQDTSRILTQQFAGIVHTLADARVPLLTREQDRSRVALAYQFPRALNKLQKNIVQFLVEVARPGQLQASPFLRGFYFSGTRMVLVEGRDGGALPFAAMPAEIETSATRVMRRDDLARPAAVPPQAARGQRQVTEWLFLPALFDGVILRDRAAHGATVVNSRTDRVRGGVLAFAGVLGIALLAAFTVSYVRNRALERDLVLASKGVAESGSPVSMFARLDQMRKPLERLIAYRSGAPLSMRWGLFHGPDLVAPAQAAYCEAIKAQILPSMIQAIRGHLQSMRGGNGDHAAEFSTLKAYMMMTTHPQKADETFLSQELMRVWPERAGRSATPESMGYLPVELRLYGALLSIPDAQSYCVNQAASGLISVSQDYLRGLSANDRYRSLLQLAGKGLEPVSYNVRFPNDAVADSKIIPGWFTRQGWIKMQQLLEHPEESLKADAWVLGESKEPSPQELASLAAEYKTLAAEYKTRYSSDFVQAWTEYLNSARVSPYANLGDAVQKLEKIGGQHSVLLQLIGLAAENTSIDTVKSIFQPAKAVVPANGDFVSAAGGYLEELNSLKNRLAKASQSTGPAHDQDIGEVRSAATTARDAVDRMAVKTFKGQTDQIVKAILLKPITQIDPLLEGDAAKDVNAGGKDLCNAWERISRLVPFSPMGQQSASLDDVQRIFQPEIGQMWRFYDKSLRDSLDCFDNNCTLKASPKVQLSRGFIEFFRNLNRWSRLIYGGNPDPVIRLQVRAEPLNHVRRIDLVLGDAPVSLSAAGGGEYQAVTWDLRRTQKLQVNGVFEGEPQIQDLFRAEGPWALFEWFSNSENGRVGSDGFVWVPRDGRFKESTFSNGNTKRYRLDIRSRDGSLDMRSPGPCTLPAK